MTSVTATATISSMRLNPASVRLDCEVITSPPRAVSALRDGAAGCDRRAAPERREFGGRARACEGADTFRTDSDEEHLVVVRAHWVYPPARLDQTDARNLVVATIVEVWITVEA